MIYSEFPHSSGGDFLTHLHLPSWNESTENKNRKTCKLLLLRSPNTCKGSGRHMLFHFIPHLNIPSCASQRGVTSSIRKALTTWKDSSVSFQRGKLHRLSATFFFFCGGGFYFDCFKWKMTTPETLERFPAKRGIKHQWSLPREDTRHLAKAQIFSDKDFVPSVH